MHDLARMEQRLGLSLGRSDLDRQRFGSQTVSTAGATGTVVLVAFKLFADPVAVGLAVAALHVGDHPFKHTAHLVNAAAFVIAELDLLLTGTAQENLLDVFRQVFPPRIFTKFIVFRDSFDSLQEIRGLTLAPRGQRAVIHLEVLIWNDKAFIKKQLFAQTITRRTGTKGGVE